MRAPGPPRGSAAHLGAIACALGALAPIVAVVVLSLEPARVHPPPACKCMHDDVASLELVPDRRVATVASLEEKLVDNRQVSDHMFFRQTREEWRWWSTSVTLEVDSDVTYGAVRPILATAERAGYERVYVHRVPASDPRFVGRTRD